MASKEKHRIRSHYSYHNRPDFRTFNMNARTKKFKKLNQIQTGLLSGLMGGIFHRMIDKGTN